MKFHFNHFSHKSRNADDYTGSVCVMLNCGDSNFFLLFSSDVFYETFIYGTRIKKKSSSILILTTDR